MPSVNCPQCQTLVHTNSTESEVVCIECGSKVLVDFKPSPPKTPEQRKTLSLFIGFVGSVIWFTSFIGPVLWLGEDQRTLETLGGIGIMLIIVALVIYFRARKEEKASQQ